MPPVGSAQDELDRIDAARRDPHAFAPLYETYADLVWRYAMRRLGDPDRAADVTSATFVQAIRALPDFQPRIRGEETTFRPWLMTIARNAVISEWRRERPTFRLDTLTGEAVLADGAPSPEEHAIRHDERERVMAALAHLSPVQRQVVELRLAGLKSAEIAELLEMRVSAVNTAHFRAIARLRDLLDVPVAPHGKGTSS
ncbi:MAG: sigma-70 family RNA polymerase sigma factor [Thermomicrobiales bacterium]